MPLTTAPHSRSQDRKEPRRPRHRRKPVNEVVVPGIPWYRKHGLSRSCRDDSSIRGPRANGPNEANIKTFSHYEIVEKIGSGGMAEVFLARDTLLERHVALKLLPESQQDDTAKQRFLREAKSAAALDHPYICKIYETGEAEGRPFIAMEYVRGETLAHRMARESLTLDEARKIALEIAEALEAAHAERIVHRDLKPRTSC